MCSRSQFQKCCHSAKRSSMSAALGSTVAQNSSRSERCVLSTLPLRCGDRGGTELDRPFHQPALDIFGKELETAISLNALDRKRHFLAWALSASPDPMARNAS